MRRPSENKFKIILKKTWKGFRFVIPIILSVLLVVAFIQAVVPVESYKTIFTGNLFLDPLIAAVLGSVSLGNPIVSYVIADSLLNSGVGLIAVAAFIVSWVTVGIVQLPAESYYFGKRFAIVRNVSSFFGAIAIGIIVGRLL